MEDTVAGPSRWLAALPPATLPPATDPALAAAVGLDLVRCWQQPHRRYHTVEHLTAVLDIVDVHTNIAADPDAVRLAAWFHDAVYDPRAADNEDRSALLAEDVLGRLAIDPWRVREVARLVRLTATHDPRPADTNGALLVDADLAILAASPHEYDRYAANVRQEYRHVDDARFIAGRTAVLRRLVERPALYLVLPDRDAMHARARVNLLREIDVLRHAGGTGLA